MSVLLLRLGGLNLNRCRAIAALITTSGYVRSRSDSQAKAGPKQKAKVLCNKDNSTTDNRVTMVFNISISISADCFCQYTVYDYCCNYINDWLKSKEVSENRIFECQRVCIENGSV